MNHVLQLIKAWLSDNWMGRQEVIMWLWKYYGKDMKALEEKRE